MSNFSDIRVNTNIIKQINWLYKIKCRSNLNVATTLYSVKPSLDDTAKQFLVNSMRQYPCRSIAESSPSFAPHSAF